MLFKEKVIKRMYKKRIQTICECNNLNYELVSKNDLYVFDETSGIKVDTGDIVVGGACIDRCNAKIENLGWNFYLDILMPMNYALEKSLDCATYVDTPIEIYSDTENFDEWLICVNKLETFIYNLGEFLGLDIKVIRRDKGVKVLDKLLQNTMFTDKELMSLYDLVPSSKNLNFSNKLLLHFRRSIISYTPQYLSEYLNRDINRVIVVEELSQIKAITKAKNLIDKIYPKIYVDMPSLSCRNRMHRSDYGKIKIFSNFSRATSSVLFEKFLQEINLDKVFAKFGVTNFEDLRCALSSLWGNK